VNQSDIEQSSAMFIPIGVKESKTFSSGFPSKTLAVDM
jgi:hypothetical protein